MTPDQQQFHVKEATLNLFQTSTQQQDETQTKQYIKLHQREQVRSVFKKTRKGKNNEKMQPLTDVFQLDILEYGPELDEEKKAVFGKYIGITMKTFMFF